MLDILRFSWHQYILLISICIMDDTILLLFHLILIKCIHYGRERSVQMCQSWNIHEDMIYSLVHRCLSIVCKTTYLGHGWSMTTFSWVFLNFFVCQNSSAKGTVWQSIILLVIFGLVIIIECNCIRFTAELLYTYLLFNSSCNYYWFWLSDIRKWVEGTYFSLLSWLLILSSPFLPYGPLEEADEILYSFFRKVYMYSCVKL